MTITKDSSPQPSPLFNGKEVAAPRFVFGELFSQAVSQFSMTSTTSSSASSGTSMSSPTPSTDTVASSASNSSDGECDMTAVPAPNSSAGAAAVVNGNVPNTKCSLCHDTFTIPKVLTCFHTFCRPCLEKLQVSPEKIACPQCQTETFLSSSSGLSGLLPDFAVSNILEANSLDNVNSLHCTCCKSKEMSAVARCFDCANFLCQNCVMAHQFMHCFEGHRVISLDVLQSNHSNKDGERVEKPIYCSKHKHEAVRFYCKTCDVPICKDCTMLEHSRGHEYDYINEVSAPVVDSLHQLADQAKVKANDLRSMAKNIEHSSNKMQVHFHKAQNEINDTFNFYVSMLEERKAETLKELDSAYNAKQVALSSTAQRMQESIKKLYQGCEFIEKLTKHAGPTEVLMFKHMLDSKLQSLLGYSPDINSPGAFDIEFISNFQAIQVGVRNTFGYVRQSGEQSKTQPPIARPNGFALPPAPVSNGYPAPIGTIGDFGSNGLGSASIHSSYSNSFAPPSVQSSRSSSLINGNMFDPSSLIGANQKFPSSGSLTVHSSTESVISNGSNPYDKWSTGGMDIFQNGDIFSTAADPMIDLTSKLITANIYPPKSQIKRQKMIYHCKFGEFGVMEGQFTEPSGVAVNAQNDIIVADTNNHRIQIFDREGRFKFQFGECGKRDGQLLYPNRVAVVRTSGDIVVTERSPTHQVQIYNQYGQFVRKFGASILQHPRGVTVDDKGRIIIVECKVMRVIIFDQMGNVLQKFGCSKHLEFPNGVVVNDKEEIFISDNRAHCVKVFSYQGVFLRQIGGEGITNYPIGVGINAAGEILIADNHNNFNLTTFTQDGQLVSALESKVKHAQCFDVALMDEGSIVLASKDYRLYIYRYAPTPAFM